ncbi:hypothetical protein D9Q98_000717 [Chlorella vulgaris]|uniref:Transportin-3 n=1 Tax=Chlorella vulgaris TaxID=3077 RepID=A0A9D4TYW0_CHLVU|nr:hypothetical protein D9Q98_000717 [Chlorella vulgaris]
MATQQQLLSALQALYHGDPAVKDQANKWLEAFQQAIEAWQVSNDILHTPSAGMEAHYFAAQTLRTKVQRDFEELPAGAAGALRDSLVAMLVQHCSGSAAVRTQLCLAIAALAAHLPASQWGPSGVVGWLAQRLGGEPQNVSLPCMLELLTVLPQEASSYQPAVRPERRRAVLDEMMAAAPQALQILAGCLAAPLPRVQEQVLDAFTSWLKLTGGVGLSGAMLMQSPLVRAALEGLRSADTFFPAVDAAVELIYCTSERGRPKEDMAPLVQLIVPEVMALKPRFHVCLQQALAERNGGAGPEGEHDDGEEDAKGMARLFAEVGEAYTGLIAEGGPQVSAPVEALLDVASHPDDAICSMSFNFWHRLSRALTIGLHPEPLDTEEAPVSDEERLRRVALFTPTLERLVALIRGRVRFHENFDSWHRDERSDFKRARVAVGDTLIDCASVLGGGRMLQLLVEPLLQLSKQVTSGAQFDWRTAEAALYCIRAVHRCAPLPGDALMVSLFGSLPQLPAEPLLQYTVALTVGAYSDWLADTAARSGQGRALLSQLLPMLMRQLSEPEASSASALSIRRLCDGCASLLAAGGSMDSLMQLYRQVQGSGDVAENSFDLDLDEDDVQQLIEGVTLVASALPDGQRQMCVQQMLDIVVQPMQGILQAAAAGPSGGDSGPGTPTAGGGAAPALRAGGGRGQLQLVLPLMERVTTIFRAVKDPADVAEALVRLWPWIEAALERFAGDAPAIERICRAPRYAVRSAGKAAAPAVPLLVASLPQRFEASRQPCFLYVASELIKTFGDEPARDQELGGMFSRMLGAACSMLRSLKDISERPDVADDTFLLAGRALNYAPRLLLTPQLLSALLDSALAGVLVQHREACCSILAFVMRLLDPATHRACAPEAVAHLQAALAPRASLLVRLVLAGVAGALPTNRLAELADVLHALLRVTSQNGLQWVAEALAAVPDGTALSTDKQRFMEACQQVVADGMAANNERVLQQAVEELSELCRRNRRAAQLAQHTSVDNELVVPRSTFPTPPISAKPHPKQAISMRTFFFTAPEDLARPPTGLEFSEGVGKEVPHQDPFDTAAQAKREAACHQAMESVFSGCDKRCTEQLSLDGHVGCVFERSPYCHAVVRNAVCAVFAGEIAAWPGHNIVQEHHDSFVRGEPLAVEDDAEWLVRFYDSFAVFAKNSDVTEKALSALSQVKGSFAFVVYDSSTKRVWAARDAAGVQPLFWGVTEDSRLVFGTDAEKLEGCNPTATPFPAGSLFASHDATLCHSPGSRGWVIQSEQTLPGQLLSFMPSSHPSPAHHWKDVKAVPRLDADGHICGAVYRVASEVGLANIRSH